MTVKKTDQSPAAIELERFLPYRLNVAAETVSRALSRIYAERFGISVPEWRVVATLGQYETMTAKQIGAHSRMHKTKVSRAVASLIDNDLLLKQPNERDRRESLLRLSAGGKQVYRAIVPGALSLEDGLFEGISSHERELFERLLKQLEERACGLGVMQRGNSGDAQ